MPRKTYTKQHGRLLFSRPAKTRTMRRNWNLNALQRLQRLMMQSPGTRKDLRYLVIEARLGFGPHLIIQRWPGRTPLLKSGRAWR